MWQNLTAFFNESLLFMIISSTPVLFNACQEENRDSVVASRSIQTPAQEREEIIRALPGRHPERALASQAGMPTCTPALSLAVKP